MSRTAQRPASSPERAVPRLAPDAVASRGPDGALRLSAPLHRRGLHRWLARVARSPERITVELDALGAWTVEHLDGRSLESLADDLARQFKLSTREARVALGQFVQSLVARRLVRLDMDAA
ncbi:MAG TPA: PqqD family peptide modification chaperone [Planctomycetota bacterium]|nr:PqqD family peptide modification chaperone [Planctomycetota bacterium]